MIAEAIVAALREHRKGWKKTLDAMGKDGRAGLAAYRAERAAKKRR
ncbi:MAG: hypothetical protein ACREUS_06515 [Burkholderiales bacterium]